MPNPCPSLNTLLRDAELGTLDAYGPDVLTLERVTEKDIYGRTILHEAAEFGHLGQIPNCHLTLENFLTQDFQGISVFDSAAQGGCLHLAPVELLSSPETLTPRGPKKATTLHGAAKNGQLNLLNNSLLTEESLTKPNSEGETPIMLAAANGHLQQIPRKYITQETLSHMPSSYSSYHLSARNGSFHQIPKELINKEILLMKDLFGETIIDWLAEAGSLDQIDKEYLNERTLIPEGSGKETTIHYAAKGGCIKDIPKKFLTPKNLLCKSTEMGYSPLDYAIDLVYCPYRNDRLKKEVPNEIAMKQLRFIIAKLPVWKIKLLIENYDPHGVIHELKKEIKRQNLINTLEKTKDSINL
jgi:ankyrin repeat protein